MLISDKKGLLLDDVPRTNTTASARSTRKEILTPALQKFCLKKIGEVGRQQFEYDLENIRLNFLKDDLQYTEDKVMSGKGEFYSEWFHLSGALDCLASQWFSRMGFPTIVKRGEDPFREWQIFGAGSDLHMRWQCLLEYAGFLKGRREGDASFVDYDDRVRGRLDGILTGLPGDPETEYLFELKSTNSRIYRQVIKEDSPLEKHIVQANGYMYYKGIKKCIFVYECKDTHKIAEFPLDLDDKLHQDIRKNRILEVESAVKEERVPEREFSEDDGLGKLCMYCDFKHICLNHVEIKRFLEEDYKPNRRHKNGISKSKEARSKKEKTPKRRIPNPFRR